MYSQRCSATECSNSALVVPAGLGSSRARSVMAMAMTASAKKVSRSAATTRTSRSARASSGVGILMEQKGARFARTVVAAGERDGLASGQALGMRGVDQDQGGASSTTPTPGVCGYVASALTELPGRSAIGTPASTALDD